VAQGIPEAHGSGIVTYTSETIGQEVQRHIDAKYGAKHGYDKVAAYEFGIHRVSLSLILHGKRPPPKKVLDEMGLEKVVMYVRKKQP